jgi:transcription initiation factor TFIID TATA-box-binding protein
MDIQGKLDVPELVQKLSKTLYEPEQFPGAIYKTEEGPTCLIFASGKIVIAGANSEVQLSNTANSLKGKLKQFEQSHFN